jgi:hypothetical protein
MQYLQSEKVDDSWSFREIDRSETSYLTHSYHRYPAKNIALELEIHSKDFQS